MPDSGARLLNAKRSMADVLKGAENPVGPIAFKPSEITILGQPGEHEGKPLLSFLPADIASFAGQIGRAVVGKFSHSIPPSHHIDKALGNIKLSGSISWKFLNAKHILIEVSNESDYAKLLSGPSSSPMWFIESHPMRVFKWTPEFDPSFETPIVAIWCNLPALPIHLYDVNALFAIGRLFGNPIQLDRATATRSRYSFARMCVEIDITKPPPETITLDLAGIQISQRVAWDKLPLYCTDCKHVGHSQESCYAFGKSVRPAKKDFHKSSRGAQNYKPFEQPKRKPGADPPSILAAERAQDEAANRAFLDKVRAERERDLQRSEFRPPEHMNRSHSRLRDRSRHPHKQRQEHGRSKDRGYNKNQRESASPRKRSDQRKEFPRPSETEWVKAQGKYDPRQNDSRQIHKGKVVSTSNRYSVIADTNPEYDRENLSDMAVDDPMSSHQAGSAAMDRHSRPPSTGNHNSGGQSAHLRHSASETS